MNRLEKIIGIGSLSLTLNGCMQNCNNVSKEVAYRQLFPFQQEKILTISGEEYCKSKGKELSDYELVGIYGNTDASWGYDKLFIYKIPQGTEVVVKLELGKGNAFGTALIPKR